jgi:hypothetical protein
MKPIRKHNMGTIRAYREELRHAAPLHKEQRERVLLVPLHAVGEDGGHIRQADHVVRHEAPRKLRQIDRDGSFGRDLKVEKESQKALQRFIK